MTKRNSHQALTALQQAILDRLWSAGPATADDVRRALRPKFPLKDSSIRTLLRRLEARGYVSHDVDGKMFVYRARLPARSVAARAVQHIIDRFCAGSVERFVIGMVDEKILSPRELKRLARKVRGKDPGVDRGKDPGVEKRHT